MELCKTVSWSAEGHENSSGVFAVFHDTILYAPREKRYFRRMNAKSSALALFLFVGLAVLPLSTSAQVVQVQPGSAVQTRAELEELLRTYEAAALSPAYSDAAIRDARLRAEDVRRRLEEGDLRVGDAILLRVEGEPSIPDTVEVQSGPNGGPVINLPTFGRIPVAGILRSEVEAHLVQELSRQIRSPLVRAEALMRISIQGAVSNPCFCVVPADMLLGEVIMAAGGPIQNAAIDDIRVERGEAVLFDGSIVREEIRLGRTLDQMNLQAGDQVVVPAQGGGFLPTLGVIVGVVSSLTLILIQVAG